MQSDIDKANELQKKAKKLNRINEQIELYKGTPNKKTLADLYKQRDTLEQEVETATKEIQDTNVPEKAAKERIERSIKCDTEDMQNKLIEICEQMGYAYMLNFIQEDIKEKQGNSTTAL